MKKKRERKEKKIMRDRNRSESTKYMGKKRWVKEEHK